MNLKKNWAKKTHESPAEFLAHLARIDEMMSAVKVEVKCECDEKGDYLVRNSQFD